MDALIKLVAEKAGIDEKQAKTAVETVLAQLKEKGPGLFGDQLEGLLGEDGPLGDVGAKLGGILGKD